MKKLVSWAGIPLAFFALAGMVVLGSLEHLSLPALFFLLGVLAIGVTLIIVTLNARTLQLVVRPECEPQLACSVKLTEHVTRRWWVLPYFSSGLLPDAYVELVGCWSTDPS